MSNINNELVLNAIKEIKKFSVDEKPRNFLETIEFQFALKNFDPSRDRRIVGSVKLPHVPKPKFKICVFGNVQHCNEAIKLQMDYKNIEQLKDIKRNKKIVKKMSKKYDAFIASGSIIKKIPKLLGPGLNRAGKFPSQIDDSAKLSDKIKEIKSTLKYNLKFKSGMPMTLSFAFANVKMTDEEIMENAKIVLAYALSTFKNKINNVKRIHVKSTMGKPHRVYGY